MPGDLPALKVEGIFVPVAPDGHIHIARGVLRGAGAEAVEAEGIFVVVAVEIVVLAAGVKLAVHKLPIVAPLSLVVSERNAAPAVVNLDRVVGKYGYGYHVAEALARFIDGVRGLFRKRTARSRQDRRSRK